MLRNLRLYMIKNKSVIITGSTSGIGLGIAQFFSKKGAKICINGFIDNSSIEQILNQLKTLGADAVMYHAADMTQPTEIEDLVNSVNSKFSSVDILINNAGIQYVSPIENFPADMYEKIIQINMSSSFYASKAAIPIMKRNNWGRIINIASAHGVVASPFKSAYVMAKHGILGLTKTLALETAQFGITANAICPGYVLTPLVEGQIKDTARARGISENEVIQNVMLANQPTKKFVKIEEVAEMAGYLASSKANSVTGSSFPLDGGWTAH